MQKIIAAALAASLTASAAFAGNPTAGTVESDVENDNGSPFIAAPSLGLLGGGAAAAAAVAGVALAVALSSSDSNDDSTTATPSTSAGE